MSIGSLVSNSLKASFIVMALAGCNPQDNAGGDQNLGAKDPTPKTLPTQIKVVVFASQCPLPTDCSASYIDQASKQVAALQPDIVIATEFFWKKANYTDFAKKVGLTYYTRGPGASQDSVTGGVVLLSRYPFKSVVTDEFKNATLPDNLVKKGTVLGKVRLGKNRAGREIIANLIGTHFQAKATGDWVGTQGLQAAQQSQFIKDNIDPSGLSLFGGDLNITQEIPDWLCSDNNCKTTMLKTWNNIVDQSLAPYRFISASQICAAGDNVSNCVAQDFSEIGEQRGDVMKLFSSNSAAYSSDGVLLIPRNLESFATISDHRTWRGIFEVKDN